jgi:hypothetical protein
MGLSQINLKNYDVVVAVTQSAINETLALYLNQLQKKVGLYYNVDANGNFVVAPDPSTAEYIFTGTLDYQLDANGNPVDMVQLYTDKGCQTVRYNITFSSASFRSTIPPQFNISQQNGGNPWIIQFLVDLGTKEVQPSSVPPATRTAIQNAVKGLGPDMFSIQQLYVDLNTAVLDTFQNIDGLTTFAGTILAGIMRSYLASLQASGGIIFGYSLTSTSANVNPPTFMPTALDFCVTPYTDSTGNHSNPPLDTLNYLVMTNNHALPPNPPVAFGFNWVDDPSIQGAMAIRHDIYVPFFINQLNPILKPLCPVCYVKADANKDNDNQTMQLNPGVDHTFGIVSTSMNGVIAQFAYSSPPASDTDPVFGGSQSVSLNYSMGCTVTANGSTVTLSGQSVISADSSSDSMGSVDDESMPPTTYSWSVNLVLQMDLANEGQLDYAIQNPNFSSAPTVAPDNESAWDKFWSNVGGVFQSFAQNPGNIRGTVQSQVIGAIAPALVASINSAKHFVFPGGSTFVFKNAQFSDSDDLAANITYLAPSVRPQRLREVAAAV